MSRLPFEVVREPASMRARAEDLRRDGRRICVVPTMGSLHEGHLSLLRAGRARADVLILTIFVNPTQFRPGEDLAKYPRDEEGDLAKARACGIDVAFCPAAEAMYPAGFQSYVEVAELSRELCGPSRPGHFRAVATVVAKLFQLTLPHLAIFGEKDYQQLLIIRRLSKDLDFGIEIVAMPIARDTDGLALSSRNAYLSVEERRQAPCLFAGLGAAAEQFARGARDADVLLAAAKQPILAAPSARLDYAELRDAETLDRVTVVKRPVVLALAVFFAQTRLIDNIILRPDRA